jgi:thiol-disulfide isomerase/thioredoxin
MIVSREINGTTLGLLGKLDHLTSLDLAGEWVTDASLQSVRHLSDIESLAVRAPNVDDAGVALIAQLGHLRDLTLVDVKLTDDGLSPLAQLTELRAVRIIGSELLTGAGLKYFYGLHDLQELTLDGARLRDVELAHLTRLSALKTLALHGEQITDAAITHLKALKGLKELRLNRTKISDEGVAVLRRALAGTQIVGGSIAAGQENLKRIGLAMHEYHSKHGHFAPALLTGPDGKTQYSWRLALLPWLGEENLFAQYRLDQPWDSANNLKVLDRMPDVYRAPTIPAGTHNTSYFAVTGPKTVFAGKDGISISQIPDGTSNVIMVVETKRAVPWTKPEDISYDAEARLPEFGGFHRGGFNAMMADGDARFIEFPPKNEEEIRFLLSKSWVIDRQKQIVAELAGRSAPDFTLKNLAGEEVTLSKLIRGKVALIAFSAVGCGPCRVEEPHLTELYEKHKREGLVVLTVNPWDEPEDLVRKYVRTENLKHAFLLNGSTVAREKYHLRRWPTSCWVNHKGVIVSVKFGFETGEERVLAREAEELLSARRRDKLIER